MNKRKTHKLGAIAARFGGELIGNPEIRISRVATLQSAQSTDIAFVSDARYLARLGKCRAGAVILGAGARDATRLPRIICADPYAYFAKVSAFLNPAAEVQPGRARSAVVHKTARIAKSAAIGAQAVIDKGAQIGERAEIGAGCYVGEGTRIGAHSRLCANVTVYWGCTIGKRCLLHSGVVIGADGFGFANEGGQWKKIPQLGGVVIGDDVEIGANTTVDRGTLDDTVIEDGAKLDNQIQIAHNVRIGANTAIAACVGIAGSAQIGRNCALGGASMIRGHITIVDNVTVSPGTVITKSLEHPGTYTSIFPFSTHPEWLRNAAHLRHLDALVKRVRELERILGKAQRSPS